MLFPYSDVLHSISLLSTLYVAMYLLGHRLEESTRRRNHQVTWVGHGVDGAPNWTVWCPHAQSLGLLDYWSDDHTRCPGCRDVIRSVEVPFEAAHRNFMRDRHTTRRAALQGEHESPVTAYPPTLVTFRREPPR